MHIQTDIPTVVVDPEVGTIAYTVPEKFCFKLTEFTVKNEDSEPVNVALIDDIKDNPVNKIEIIVPGKTSVTTTCIMRHFYEKLKVTSTGANTLFSASGYLC